MFFPPGHVNLGRYVTILCRVRCGAQALPPLPDQARQEQSAPRLFDTMSSSPKNTSWIGSGAEQRLLIITPFAILLLQAGIALWAGLPGQLTTDSIIQLYEGRSHQTISFHPPFLSILLGIFDHLGNAPVAFVLLSQMLLSASTWIVLTASGKSAFWRLLVAAAFLLNPVVLAYVGIVIKDVLFAHVVVFLFLLLWRWQLAAQRITPCRQLLLLALLMAVVGLRQQGILFALVASFWIATLITHSRPRILLISLAFITAPLLLNQQITRLVQKPAAMADEGTAVGLKILMRYDLAGIMANGGTVAAEPYNKIIDDIVIRKMQVQPNGKEIRKLPQRAFSDELAHNARLYTPDRVDTLQGHIYSLLPLYRLGALWLKSVRDNPRAYWQHRVDVSAALLGFSDIRQCAPLFSGSAGPIQHPLVEQELTAALDLTPGPNHSTVLVLNLLWDLIDTPLFQHWIYTLTLIPIALVLGRRRAYIPLSLAVCSLTLLASYFILGIACDFRYAYALTLSTSLLAACVVLPPRAKSVDAHDAPTFPS